MQSIPDKNEFPNIWSNEAVPVIRRNGSNSCQKTQSISAWTSGVILQHTIHWDAWNLPVKFQKRLKLSVYFQFTSQLHNSEIIIGICSKRKKSTQRVRKIFPIWIHLKDYGQIRISRSKNILFLGKIGKKKCRIFDADAVRKLYENYTDRLIERLLENAKGLRNPLLENWFEHKMFY